MHDALFATERTLTISDLNRQVRERLETTFPLTLLPLESALLVLEPELAAAAGSFP